MDRHSNVYKSQETLLDEQKQQTEDEDYVYYNDIEQPNEAANTNESNNFSYKKYRGQNIRQKKIKSATGPIHLESGVGASSTSISNDRPRSASSLLLMQQSTAQTRSSQSGLYSSASQTNLNPIGTLYEMSKNYKSIRQLEEDDNQNKLTTNSKSSGLVSRSSIQLSNCAAGGINDDDEDDDDKPVKEKLCQQQQPQTLINSSKTKPTLRSATTVTNSSVMTLPRPASNLSIKTKTTLSSVSTASSTGSTASTGSMSSSSRARSRTPTSTCSSLLNEQQQQQSYRQPTVASVNREVSNQMGNKAANLSTSSSTQYLPINTQSFQKKRTIF